MDPFKLTSWNVEWLVDAYKVAEGQVAPGSRVGNRRMPSLGYATAKLAGIRAALDEMAPDIVLFVEAVPGREAMKAYATKHLPDYEVIDGGRATDREFDIEGEQWIWFLVRKTYGPLSRCGLLPVPTWKTFTATNSNDSHAGGKWKVSLPELRSDGTLGPNRRKPHKHHRHPQVLVVDSPGFRVEFVGVHLKSRHINTRAPRRLPGESLDAYLDRPDVQRYLAEAYIARAKLSSEATDVRYYIEQRFEQEPLPAIFVLGDVNDGPGREVMEREFLLHDLISNLQGDVFLASRFLNHALFDFPDELRWSATFKDPVEPDRPPNMLIDHIVFTEALSRRGVGPLIVRSGAGVVEHAIYERINSLMPGGKVVSDHRPLSLVVSPRPPSA